MRVVSVAITQRFDHLPPGVATCSGQGENEAGEDANRREEYVCGGRALCQSVEETPTKVIVRRHKLTNVSVDVDQYYR